MKSLKRRREICNRLGERWYPKGSRRDLALQAAVAERLPRDGVFVDAGSGPWMGLARLYAASCRLAVGLDVVPMHVEAFERGARGVAADLTAVPLRPETVDVITMRSVMEHLEDPAAVLAGFARVLKPGGWVVALAPSRWYYASLVGRLLPERANHALLRFIFGPTVYDNFPTWYRANTPSAVRRAAAAAGLELVEARACPHPPDYLKFSPLLFRIGVLFDRAAGLTGPTRLLQASYLYLLRKPR